VDYVESEVPEIAERHFNLLTAIAPQRTLRNAEKTSSY
jgi:hypothetical protein